MGDTSSEESIGAAMEDRPTPFSSLKENLVDARQSTLRREKGGPPPSIFEKYITELPELNREESLLREKRIVECKLCRETGTESRITRRNLSRHMSRFHLPAEECKVCGQIVKPVEMPRH